MFFVSTGQAQAPEILVKPIQGVSNSQTSEFYPIWHNNELWYLSNYSKSRATEKVYSIWKFGKTKKKILLDLQALEGVSNVGSITFVPGTEQVYLTLTVNGFFKIYQGTLQNDIVRFLKPAGFNTEGYNVMHPAVAPGGRSIIFASDMGTYGKTDLFQVFKQEDGSWSVPYNLGPSINSPLNDAFPYWDPTSGLLFFASKGHQSKGGYDLFVSRLSGNKWSPAFALSDLNTRFDDLGLCLEDQDSGYFSSNRTGNDEVYHFQLTKGSLIPPKAKSTIQVILDFQDPALKKPVACKQLVSKSEHFKVVRPLSKHEVLIEVVPDIPLTFLVYTEKGEAKVLNHTFQPRDNQQRLIMPLNEQVLYWFSGRVFDENNGAPLSNIKMVLRDDCSKDSIVFFSEETGSFSVAFSSPCKEALVQFPDTKNKPGLISLYPAEPHIMRNFKLKKSTFKPLEVRSNCLLLTSDCDMHEPEIEQLVKLLQNHHALQVSLQMYYLRNGRFEESCEQDFKSLRKLKSFLILRGISSNRLNIPCEENAFPLHTLPKYSKKGYKIQIKNPNEPFELNPLDWDFKIIPGD